MVRTIGMLVGVYLIGALIVGWIWSDEPDEFVIDNNTRQVHGRLGIASVEQPVVGAATTSTLITLANTLLEKPGGYITNDILPPGLWLDNIEHWEFGVLVQVRDLARVMRQDISRSQSQSVEDDDLKIAEPQLNFDSDSWAIPSTEREYRRGIKALESYLVRLVDPNQPDAQFYARADNLRAWLKNVETRLGSLSQRLSESVGKQQLNVDLAGDPSATQSTVGQARTELKTSWFEIDDVFYEARGATWALIHILKSVETDFDKVLRDKNAKVSLQQIILELEATQESVWSPVILNGSGFGMLANHSLTMASYISRVNAAIIDLRSLLQQG